MIHIREPNQPLAEQPLALPRSVVWLNRGTLVLVILLSTMLLGLGLRTALHLPMFAISSLQLLGDTQYHSAIQIKASVLPQLSGNYFTLDLRRAQAQFEALPWIRSAVVQRRFPNVLQVQLTAHVPAAKWSQLSHKPTNETEAERDAERLVNVQGEVFEAAGGQMDTSLLPELSGPAHSAPRMLALLQQLQTSLQTYASDPTLKIEQLRLNSQGLWRAVLDNQAVLELGAGEPSAVLNRTRQWLAAMPQVTRTYGARSLHSADLRYASGFAVHLAGVTTHRK